MIEPLYLLPDTNALLHWPLPDQVDWIKLSEPQSSCILLITFSVIHELDEKKTHPHLGERAQKVLRFIKHRRSTEIRPGVSLEVDHHECQREEFQDGTTLVFD